MWVHLIAHSLATGLCVWRSCTLTRQLKHVGNDFTYRMCVTDSGHVFVAVTLAEIHVFRVRPPFLAMSHRELSSSSLRTEIL